ncbi:MAG: cytochrome c [Amphritea sp.]
MKRLLIGSTLLGVLLISGWSTFQLSANVGTIKLESQAGDVARGAYLARVSGCIACHTRIEEGGRPLAGGPPLTTPFGTFHAPNLTTDKAQGIGSWSLDDFARALRQGVSPQGQPYYPAFPYSFYSKLSDQDIADLWAAFQTVPAVTEAGAEHQLGFPYNVREGLTLWQGLFFKPQSAIALRSDDERYNRGAYLVESASHCGACHTPRNLLGGLDDDRALQGAENLLDGSSVPAISAGALQDAGWTSSDLAYALKTGLKPDGDVFGGAMGEVVRDGTAFMTPQDRDAIAYFLLNRE